MKVLIIGNGGHISKMMEMAEELRNNPEGYLIVQHAETDLPFVHMGRTCNSARAMGKTLDLAIKIAELKDKGYLITTLEESIDFGVPKEMVKKLSSDDFKIIAPHNPKGIHQLALAAHDLSSLQEIKRAEESIPFTIRPLPKYDEPPRDKWGNFLTNPGSKYHK